MTKFRNLKIKCSLSWNGTPLNVFGPYFVPLKYEQLSAVLVHTLVKCEQTKYRHQLSAEP